MTLRARLKGRRGSPRKQYLLRCDGHGEQLAYAVCIHVLDGAEVAMFDEATPSHIGGIGCEACEARTTPVTADVLKMVCERCCKERGWIPTPKEQLQ